MPIVSFVYDTYSQYDAEELLSSLETAGYEFYSSGMIPDLSEYDEESILAALQDIINGADFVVGISASGNSIAIYANKIDGFNGSSIVAESEIELAISEYKINVFDISVNNEKALSIITNILNRID